MPDHSFYFLRHGQTQWNKDRIIQGQADSLLNDTGRAQAKRAAEILRSEPIERIISSPLSRVRDTAQAVAAAVNLPVTYDDDLRECHLGDHQGEPYGEWVPHYWTGDYTPPNGEHFNDFAARAWGAMQNAIALGPNTLIVAHGGLWIAAQQFITLETAMPQTPNALPMHITQIETQTHNTWQHRILEI